MSPSSSPIGEDANAKKSHLLANVTIVDRQFGDCHTGNSPIWRMSHWGFVKTHGSNDS